MNTFIQVLRRTDKSTIVLQCSLKSSTLTPKIYFLRNIFPNGLPVSTPSRPSFAPVCVPVHVLGPNRSGPRLLQPIRPMLSLSLNTPHQAQLEALRVLPDHHSGSSWLHASLALLDLFDSERFDPSGRLVCSHGPSQLPCCRGVGTSSTAFFSAWPSVDSVYPNQTSEPTRLPLIGFRSHPSWLSPTRL